MVSNLAINDSQDFAAYAVVRPDYVYELYVYDFATQEHTKLMNMDGYVSNIGWTPDNRSLILSMGGEIYRLDLVPRDQFEYDEDFWADALALDAEPEEQEEEPQEESEPPIEESQAEAPVEETPTEEPEVIEEIEPQEPEEMEKPTLEIYWPGLKQRLVRILKDSEAYLYLYRMEGDNKFYYFSNGSRFNKNFILKSATIYGKDSKTELDFGFRSFNIVHSSGVYYYISNGTLYSCAIGAAPKEIPVDVDYEWDEATLNTRVFEEVWGVFGENFYDPGMHGKDWQAMYDLYLPYAQQARNVSDLATVVDEMIGDVNASHTGFYPRREPEQGRYNQTTYLGLEFDLANRLDKGLKVSFVYPHTRLDHYYKLQVGDLLTHIDGHEITAHTPVDSLLMNKVGKRIYLKLQRDGEEIEADINGLSWSEIRKLGYEHKIAKRRQMVDELTDSQVGYIHIPAMGTENYDQFTKELYTDNVDKKALIIDVRGNVGGRIHDQLISILIKKHYAYTTSRRRTYQPRPEPYSAWDKPSIVLVDEHSFSDGEIFPIVYQQLKLGKVVGYPSSGAVIGTWEYSLVDGSSMRLPGSGWYKMDGTNMEGTGAMPDIIIQHTPNDTIADRDPQLQRAIEEILKEI
jgi:tricorn protease